MTSLSMSQRRRRANEPIRSAVNFRQILLACGIVSSLVYMAINILLPMQWPSYSVVSQTISELSAWDAPTRSMWVWPGALYTVLITAFGFGVFNASSRQKALRIAGGMIIGFGALGILWPFASMHSREVLAAGGGTFADMLHLGLAGASVLLMFLAIAFGAVALGRRFRVYSIVSVAILLVSGGITGMSAPKIQANLPTPWVGVWERISIGVFLLWIVVLALALLRRREDR